MLISSHDLRLAIDITKCSIKASRPPSVHHAMIQSGALWATDGDRLIKCPLSDCLDEYNGRFLVHHIELKAMIKRKSSKQIDGCKFYEFTKSDFRHLDLEYPDCTALLPSLQGLEPVDVFGKSELFTVLQGPSLKYVEFAVLRDLDGGDNLLQAAFHEKWQSTYPSWLQGSEGLAKTLEVPTAFDTDHLKCMAAFSFETAKFTRVGRSGGLHLHHTDGHEALIMAVNLSDFRNLKFKWLKG